MKEIVVTSGKGGTGKTSLAASFAFLGGKEIVAADCDVDAADMHLLLEPDFADSREFFCGEIARINQRSCSGCGRCQRRCRFGAIVSKDGDFFVDSINCEGCGYCARICPENAITMTTPKAGEVYISTTKTGGRMVHASLKAGAENSGKLVAEVKKTARKMAEDNGREIIVVDGSPGIGCPVVSSLSGADYVIFITEPTVSGIHDFKRVNELRKKFSISAGCIINKSDLSKKNTREIEVYLREEGIQLIGTIPYNEAFTRAITQGKTIIEYDGDASRIPEFWNRITREVV